VTDAKTYDGNTSSTQKPTIAPPLVIGDSSGFTQAFNTKHAGIGNKTLIPAGSANDGNSGANYSVTFVNFTTGTINPLAITVTAAPTTKVFDGTTLSSGVPTIMPLPFLVGGDTPSFTQTYDNKNAGTGKTLTPSGSVNDGNGGLNYSVTFAVNKNGVITAKSTVTSVTVSPNSMQYSDPVTFSAAISPANINGESPAAFVEFYVGTECMGIAAVDPILGTAALTKPLIETTVTGCSPVTTIAGQMAPGSHGVTAVFTGVDLNFAVANPTTTLTITQEDARVNYAGNMFIGIPTSSTSASVTLIATIQDITAVTGDSAYDAYPGDIRNATVTFVNRDSSNATLCTAPVLLVNSADTKTGSVTCTFTGTVGSTGSTQYTVGIVVSGYYTRNTSTDDTVVTVSQVGAGMITGGGYAMMQNSAGTIAGDPGTKNNFGFNVKYNKSGTNLQGNLNTIVRRKESDGTQHGYQIKGTSMSALAVYQRTLVSGVWSSWSAGCPLDPSASSPCKAQFNGKANIQDITNPLGPVTVSGNNSLQFNMTDYGSPGSSDTIGITLWNGSGGIWFSTNWTGNPPATMEQVLGGGDLTVH
jgi:hypothetical protein